ncbi:hypothetical protein GF389_01255, partial [Candidatus Dojkabacteria bacterium]|nr:hypothetical protein [Candidatus Dojkabacteria bacterium]
MSEVNKKWFIIPQKNKKLDLPRNPILMIVAAVSIYSMILPAMIIDISTVIYQEIYFSIMKIPKIKRVDYLVFDRQKLKQLTPTQKLGCVYCSYVNGILAWCKAVANQTET